MAGSPLQSAKSFQTIRGNGLTQSKHPIQQKNVFLRRRLRLWKAHLSSDLQFLKVLRKKKNTWRRSCLWPSTKPPLRASLCAASQGDLLGALQATREGCKEWSTPPRGSLAVLSPWLLTNTFIPPKCVPNFVVYLMYNDNKKHSILFVKGKKTLTWFILVSFLSSPKLDILNRVRLTSTKVKSNHPCKLDFLMSCRSCILYCIVYV